MIVNADIVQSAAQATQRDAEPVRAAETAELAAAFDVRFEIEEYTRNSATLQASFETRNGGGKIAEDGLVPAVADVGGNEMFQSIFVDMADARAGLGWR